MSGTEKTLAGGTCLRNLIELAVEFIQLGLDGSPPFHQLLDQCCHPRREDLFHRILRPELCYTGADDRESLRRAFPTFHTGKIRDPHLHTSRKTRVRDRYENGLFASCGREAKS